MPVDEKTKEKGLKNLEKYLNKYIRIVENDFLKKMEETISDSEWETLANGAYAEIADLDERAKNIIRNGLIKKIKDKWKEEGFSDALGILNEYFGLEFNAEKALDAVCRSDELFYKENIYSGYTIKDYIYTKFFTDLKKCIEEKGGSENLLNEPIIKIGKALGLDVVNPSADYYFIKALFSEGLRSPIKGIKEIENFKEGDKVSFVYWDIKHNINQIKTSSETIKNDIKKIYGLLQDLKTAILEGYPFKAGGNEFDIILNKLKSELKVDEFRKNVRAIIKE